jgi:hypothetical protein
MVTGQLLERSAERVLGSANGLADTKEWSLIQELQDENKRLREIVIYLSEIVVRNAVERK